MDPRVTLITLGVSDLERALRFYRDGLGWRLSSASVEGDVAFFQAGGLVVALWSRAELANDANLAPDDGWGAVTLAHNLPSRTEVDRVVEEMLRAGGRMLKTPVDTAWGGYSGYVADPDGHPWEIAWNPHWPLGEDGTIELPA